MKIEMTVDLIGEDGSLLAGDVIEMEKGRAVSFIQAGYAKAVSKPVEPVATQPTQESVEAELTALGVAFLGGADLGSLVALLNGVKAAKPDPLDHDRDGRKGGSRKASPPPEPQSEGL